MIHKLKFNLSFFSAKWEKENSSPIEVLSRRKRPRPLSKNKRVDDLEVIGKNDLTALKELDSDVMLSLKQFCSRMLLDGRYNKLMRNTKDMVCDRAVSGPEGGAKKSGLI